MVKNVLPVLYGLGALIFVFSMGASAYEGDWEFFVFSLIGLATCGYSAWMFSPKK